MSGNLYLDGAILRLMLIKSVASAIVMTLLLVAHSRFAFAQANRKVEISVVSHGSVPPIPEWYSCFRELNNMAYDKAKSQACLRSILSHPGILKGGFSLHHYRSHDVLTLELESPFLNVRDLDLGVSAEELARAHGLLAINGDALQPGDHYDDMKESSTWNVLNMLLLSQGRRAGISRTAYLDYERRTARVEFKLWDGPRDSPLRLLPPYAEPCKILNGNFNWMDVDDLSPLSFIRRQMKTRWLGCFSETDVQHDLAVLKEMKFLRESNISVEGSGSDRSISVHLRSHPIPIAEIRVRGYGLLDGQIGGKLPPLTIHAGDMYSRSASQELAELLKKAFMKDGRQVRVFTDVEISGAGKADLEFSVLAYPDDTVYVNGVKYDGSFPDKTNLPD